MTQHITNADLKGLKVSALKRIYAASREAVVAAGICSAERFDAHTASFGGTKPRDLAIAALDQVSLIGSRVRAANASPQTLAEGGFFGGETRFEFGNGPALARQIIAAA